MSTPATHPLVTAPIGRILEAPDAATAERYRESARQALTDFRDSYPDSVRAAAVVTLLQSLPF